MEVVAGDYVNELISRSMIQIAELNYANEIKSYRIHDLMRETIQSKCKEECFSTTIITGGSQEGMREGLHEKARRISIYNNNINGDENYYNNYSMGLRCSHIRSLMMFQLDESPTWSFEKKFFCAFRLLKVLDLEGAHLTEFLPELVELIHLTYLSLRRTKITVLPKSVGKLKNLETLDLKYTRVSELPVEILKLQRLRHLLVYRYESYSEFVHTYGVSVPTRRIGNLTCLQTLVFLDVQQQHQDAVLKELGKLTQLRRLGITNLRSKDGRDLCFSLQKMEHLHSLTISRSSYVEQEFLELESLISPPQFLRHLYLNSRLRRLPAWIPKSLNLTDLRLRFSRLPCEEDDPLKAFQNMPNLVSLELLGAYDGDELCCSEVGGYKNLKMLWLFRMEGLKRVRFRQGSMPMLRELTISDFPALEMVPLGIEHLSGLQVLSLYRMHPELMKRIRKVQGKEAQGEGGGEDFLKVKHIPTIKHRYRNTQGIVVYENLE